MQEEKILKLYGLALRARQAKAGVFGTRTAIEKKRAKCVLLAGDAEESTKKEIRFLCEKYGIFLIEFSSKAAMGNYAGKEGTACAAILDEHFTSGIRNYTIDGGAFHDK